MRKKYNMPPPPSMVKTRMTDEEYADLPGGWRSREISQSEFIRQAIRKATIRPIVTVSRSVDGCFAALSAHGRVRKNRRHFKPDCPSLNEYRHRGPEKEVRGEPPPTLPP